MVPSLRIVMMTSDITGSAKAASWYRSVQLGRLGHTSPRWQPSGRHDASVCREKKREGS
jgi:hypothetical protein